MLEFEFSISQELARPVLEKSFPQKFRTTKSTYRQEILSKHDKLENAIEACPKGVDPGHWKEFVTQEFTEKVQEKNRKNAETKRKSGIAHTLGRTSYAQKRYKMQQKNPGKKVRRLDCWKEAHTRADGSVLESAEEKYDQLKAVEERKRNESAIEDGINSQLQDDLDNDELVEVFGEDLGNRTRAVSSYMSKKQLHYNDALTTLAEQKNVAEVEKVNAIVANMQIDLSDMKTNMKSDISTMKDLIGVMAQQMEKMTTTFQQQNTVNTFRNEAGSILSTGPSSRMHHNLSSLVESSVPHLGPSLSTNRKVTLLNEGGTPVAKGYVVTDKTSQICHGKKVGLGEKKIYVEEVLVGDALIYNAPQDGNLTLHGFVEGGFLIWLEARLQFY